ncbi:MAG: tyrosine-type recombinase/integrase [Deltaproteobacteria bacterium]
MNTEPSATILSFPSKALTKRVRKSGGRVRSVDSVKYFNAKQIKMIRRTVRDQAELDSQNGNVTGIREWMVIDLLTSTGLRVSEAANLRCCDLKIGYAESKIFIREGKGRVSGHVVINDALKKHLRAFTSWKREQGEQTGEDNYLFVGQRGEWTSQAIQQIVKKYLIKLDLYEKGKSVHALRHSYAVELYSKAKDLRAVQKQLRHVSIQSTLVYADVTDESIGNQIKGLWN